MKASIILCLLFGISLIISCANTRKNSENTIQSKTTPKVEAPQEELLQSQTAELSEQYLPDEIYLALKPDSEVILDTDLNVKNLESPLQDFFAKFDVVDIKQPMLPLKPHLYRITFAKDTDLVAATETLESYVFVQYAELIPLNK